MNARTHEIITRTTLADGSYRYESSLRGITHKSSKVLYSHVALFAPMEGSGRFGPITFHKTAAAAERTRGEIGPEGPYWVKLTAVEIVDGGHEQGAAADAQRKRLAAKAAAGTTPKRTPEQVLADQRLAEQAYAAEAWTRIEDGYERGAVRILDNGAGLGPAKGSGRWAVLLGETWLANVDTLDEAKAYRTPAPAVENLVTVTVDSIRAGDQFVAEGRVYWTAVADAETYDEANDSTTVEIRHADGGHDHRVWDDSQTTLTVIRAWENLTSTEQLAELTRREAAEVVESHPVFAALSPEARATVAKNARKLTPLDYDAEIAAKDGETIVFLGADGQVYGGAAPGMVPVRWDAITGSWFDVDEQLRDRTGV